MKWREGRANFGPGDLEFAHRIGDPSLGALVFVAPHFALAYVRHDLGTADP